jgi:hypothetical protein
MVTISLTHLESMAAAVALARPIRSAMSTASRRERGR